MNRYQWMHRVSRWIPMSPGRRFRFTRTIFDRQLKAEQKEVEALRDPEKLESFHFDWQYEYHMLADEERDYYSRKLQDRARHLRVLVPKVYEGSNVTDDYEESTITGKINLSLQGENNVRAAIREEEKLRAESRARLIPYITAVAGLIGTATGLLAVIDKWGK